MSLRSAPYAVTRRVAPCPTSREWWADLRRRKPIQTWWADIRRRRPIAEFVGELADRDQEAQGSVLGSAVALRIFLFLVPASVVIVSLIVLLDVTSLFDGDQLEKGYTTQDIFQRARGRERVERALAAPQRAGPHRVGRPFARQGARRLLRGGVAAAGLAVEGQGRGRARASPASCSSRSSPPPSSASIRDLGGAPAWALSWGTLVAITGVAWFFVLLTLPRAVNDPGALLPGAFAVGLVQGSVQAVLQAYTEGRVERTTDTYGDLAVTLAILGNLFILGRIMTASFVVTAVTYERFGSLSEAIFALPFVRRLPRRYPWLAEFFSLEIEGTERRRPGRGRPRR